MPFEEEVVDAGTKDDRQEESVENVMVSFGFRCVIDKAIWDASCETCCWCTIAI